MISFRCEMFCLLFSSVWMCLMLGHAVNGRVWREITACYGSDHHCSRFKMECTGGTRIVLGALMYGTKPGNQDCQLGISDCKEMKDKVQACCSYNTSDTFTPFSASNMSTVLETCEGQTACSGLVPRLQTTPTSSYVWMQYTCVSDKNMTDMCSNNTIVGQDLFVRFNITSNGAHNSLSTSSDCSCRISTPGCSVAVTTTLVDLDFGAAHIDASTSVPGKSSACQYTALEFGKQNKNYNCMNTQLNAKAQAFKRMTELPGLPSPEVVSLRNISTDENTGPNYVVLYFRTLPKQPLLINCFEPGLELKLTNQCGSTTNPTVSTDVTSSSSKMYPTDQTSLSETNTLRLANLTSTVSSLVSPDKTSTYDQSLTRTTLPAKSFISQEHLSSSVTVSKSFSHQTTTYTEQLAMDSPSTRRPVPPFSRLNSQQSTSIHLSSPDSNSATADTNIVTDTSTKYSPSFYTTTINSEPTDKHSSSRMTSTTTVFNSTSVSPTLLRTKVTSRKPDLATFRPGEKSDFISTTISAHKNEHSIVEETTGAINRTTQTTGTTTEKKEDDSRNNNGLIIGITVAVVLVILLIVAVVMVCLCIRIKRQERVRQNYVRNTNIFYSFPEDYNDAGSTKSEISPEADTGEPSFQNIPRSQTYESVGNPSPYSTLSKVNSPLYFDQYKIESSTADETDTKRTLPYSVMPNDNNYFGETSNETINFVNGVENDNEAKAEAVTENGGKSVSFDPSVNYAQVRKEGRTKF